MLTDYLEDFTLLERRVEPDGLGGQTVTWAEAETLSLALAPVPACRREEAGQPAAPQRARLLGRTRLDTGARVRREADGTVWRVEVGGCAYRTPATAWQTYWQMEAEAVP